MRALSLALLLSACGTDAVPRPLASALPRARLAAPVQVAAGTTVLFDAQDSFDPDGALISWRFVFGDGSAASDVGVPTVLHAFSAAGVYEVGLTVRDSDGGEARARQTVSVGATTMSCDGASECEGPGPLKCMGSICYRTGGGLDCDGAPCSPVCTRDEECLAGQRCRSGICAQ